MLVRPVVISLMPSLNSLRSSSSCSLRS
uniref:Uncharacterized protein n=1 Tax=Arundo donax TaxID=35708 RepID=A0A0A8ZVB4_ARUDO